MKFSEYLEIADQTVRKHLELVELRRAVGPWPWRAESIRASGGKDLSEAMTLMLALIAFEGYEFGVGAIEKAQVVGTYNQVNRAAQYTTADPRELLRAVNEAWSKIRTLEKELIKRDTAIAALRDKLRRSQIVNVTLTSIITALAVRGLEVLFQAAQHTVR